MFFGDAISGIDELDFIGEFGLIGDFCESDDLYLGAATGDLVCEIDELDLV